MIKARSLTGVLAATLFLVSSAAHAFLGYVQPRSRASSQSSTIDHSLRWLLRKKPK